MAIPSGSGTEVLKVNRYQNISTETIVFQGVADHIYTILSIIVCNTDGAANREIYLKICDGSGTANDHHIVMASIIPASGTYVWNDKFVVSGAYNIRATQANGSADIIVSYIDQDWS